MATPDRIIGVGHRYRRDDGVGPFVANALRELGHQAVAHEGEGSALIDLWRGLGHVVVIDAVSGGEPGATIRLDGLTDDLGRLRFVRSTHDLGLPEAIELGRQFGDLPTRLDVIGIVGRDFAMGETMTPAVERAARDLIVQLQA